MKHLLALVAAFVLLTSAVFAQNGAAQTDLVSQLPPADMVLTVNLKRLLNDALPQLLSAKPEELAKLNSTIEEAKAKTGIDLRQFEELVVGLKLKQTRAGDYTGEPVMMLRGTFDANAMLGMVKLASNGKYRQEKVLGKNIYIFTIPQAARDAAKQAGKNAPPRPGEFDKFFDSLITGEMAVTSPAPNTLLFGKPLQIRTALSVPTKTGTNRVSEDFVTFINRRPDAVMNFAVNIPASALTALKLPDDQIGRLVKSVRQMYGSVDMNDGNTSLVLAAKTAQEAQAQELEELLAGFQLIGKGFIGSKSDEQSKVFARILETVKITRNLSEVQLEAAMSKADLDILLNLLMPKTTVSLKN